jgi:hypothetical protein
VYLFGGRQEASQAKAAAEAGAAVVTQQTQSPATSGSSRRKKRGGKKGDAPPSPPDKQQQQQPAKKNQQKRLTVASALAGKIIGQGGATVKDLQARSGCNITLDRSYQEGAPDRVFVLQGRPEAIAEAERLILWTLQRARESVGGGGVSSGDSGGDYGSPPDSAPRAGTSPPSNAARAGPDSTPSKSAKKKKNKSKVQQTPGLLVVPSLFKGPPRTPPAQSTPVRPTPGSPLSPLKFAGSKYTAPPEPGKLPMPFARAVSLP